MVSRLCKMLSFVRDSVVFSFSVVVLSSSWGQWTSEPVFYVLDGFGAAFIALAVIDVTLLVKRVERRAFYAGNAIYQMFPSFMLAGVIPFYGLVLMTLNLIILFSLREKPFPGASPAPGSKAA